VPRLLCGLVGALALACGTDARAQSAPFSVEDLLNQESIGNVRISPNSRWVVIDREAAWGGAGSYDLGQYTAQLLTSLEIHDASGTAPLKRVADPGHGKGFVSGPFSPNGEEMVVYRLTARTLRLGILTLSTGDVRWHDLTPEWPNMGQTVAWRSDRELVVIARPHDDLPLGMRNGWEAQARSSQLWSVAAAGHEPSSVYVSSGSRRNDREKPRTSALVRLDAVTGSVTKIRDGDFFDFALSPDRRSVVAMTVGEDVQPELDDRILTGTPAQRRRLILASIETGEVTYDDRHADYLPYLMAWSPDSTRVLTFRRTDGQSWRLGGFTVLSTSGLATSIPDQGARPRIHVNARQIPYARGAWDGERPVVHLEVENGGQVWRRIDRNGGFTDLESSPGQILAEHEGRLLIGQASNWRTFDGRDAGPRHGPPLAPARAQDGGGRAAVNPTPAVIADSAGRTDAGCLVRQIGASPEVCIGASSPGASVAAVAPDLSFAVETRLSETGSTTVRLRNAGEARVLATLNSALDDVAWGEIRPIEHPAPDGSPLKSWLLLPPGVRPTALPVVMIIYPGTSYPAAPPWLRPGSERRHINPALLAAAGYAVLVPSLPLYDSDGHALDDLGARLGAILDRAAESGAIDPHRAAVLGHSYGGFGAMTVATQTDRFQAIIASAGRSSLSDLLELPPQYALIPENGSPFNVGLGWAETGQGRMGASIIADPSRYVAASPVYRAANVTTPTLVIDGDLDFSRGRGLFGALYRMNREAGLVTYAGEGHVFVSPANIRDLHTRIIEWLDRYLSPSAQPRLPVPGPTLQDGR
jgi:dipeptidyl aminopeptidase/acylaminoacyl peptidase